MNEEQVLHVIPSSYLIKLSSLLTLAVTAAEMINFGLCRKQTTSITGP